MRKLVDGLASSLPPVTRDDAGIAQIGRALRRPVRAGVFLWCAASTWRRDVRLVQLLEAAARSSYREQVSSVARGRVVEGPLVDAIACVPLLGDGTQLILPENGRQSPVWRS